LHHHTADIGGRPTYEQTQLKYCFKCEAHDLRSGKVSCKKTKKDHGHSEHLKHERSRRGSRQRVRKKTEPLKRRRKKWYKGGKRVVQARKGETRMIKQQR